jgi:hypothetical protein
MQRFYPGARIRSRSPQAMIIAALMVASAFASQVKAGEPAATTSSPLPPVEMGSKAGNFLQDLLPTAWQKRPKLRFNVFTEMTPEGRKWRTPTAQEPLRYFSPPGTYATTGWLVAAGEKPPPWQRLQEAMQKALAANGYVPIPNDQQRPDVLIVFTFGAHGTDLAQLAQGDEFPVTAEELMNWALSDTAAIQDVIERARFIGGPRVGDELAAALQAEVQNARTNRNARRPILPVNPDPGSPFQMLLRYSDSDAMRQVVELAFHSCYFVTATAYDFAGVEKKQKRPLWQTRMTVEAQGVAMEEVLRPLIVTAGAFIGRETPEAVIVDKRINREGQVEIGTATVVDDAPAGDAKDKAGK